MKASKDLLDSGCYFQVGKSLKLGMSIPTAFGVALHTWASWIEKNINTNRTHVFFRTFEPSHWKYVLSVDLMSFSQIPLFWDELGMDFS